MVWSLALRSDDAKQDSVVYGTKFGVVFLAEGPRAASIQKGFKCTPYHTKARRGKRLNDGSRLDVGPPPTKLLLRFTEQLLHVQQIVFVEATFPSKALGAVQV